MPTLNSKLNVYCQYNSNWILVANLTTLERVRF